MDNETIRVGVVGRAHGVQGAVRVFMDDPQSDTLLHTRSIFLGPDRKPFSILSANRCGRFVAVSLEGIDDRDKAFSLTGLEVHILRSNLKKLRKGWYVCDLIGLAIIDETGRTWGTVTDLLPGGSYELLQYKRSDGSLGLVPFVSAHIGSVNCDDKTILADAEWIEQIDAINRE